MDENIEQRTYIACSGNMGSITERASSAIYSALDIFLIWTLFNCRKQVESVRGGGALLSLCSCAVRVNLLSVKREKRAAGINTVGHVCWNSFRFFSIDDIRIVKILIFLTTLNFYIFVPATERWFELSFYEFSSTISQWHHTTHQHNQLFNNQVNIKKISSHTCCNTLFLLLFIWKTISITIL